MAPAAERAFVATPLATAGARVIASPFQFWTTGEDSLRIISVCSATGVALKVQARFLSPDGTISAASWDHTPNANRTTKSDEFPLGVGAALNLVVFAGTGTVQIGQCFVIVHLIRGRNGAAIVLGTLLQGYVTGTQVLAWPGSPIVNSLEGTPMLRTIIGTHPAPGADILETVPTGARWHLLAVDATLGTTGAGAVRYPRLEWGPAATPVGRSAANDGLNISSIGTFTWVAGLPLERIFAAGVLVSGLAVPLLLRAGEMFRTVTATLQAGDTWEAPHFSVFEWLEVP